MSDAEGAGEAVEQRFVWIDDGDVALGGQWMAVPEVGAPRPIVLADVVAARRAGARSDDPLAQHVRVVLDVVAAAGRLEDELFPDPATRLQSALVAVDADTAEVDPATPEGERVRRGAEALEKLAADLAEVVEERLDGGCLADLPPDTTLALCQASQTAWRLRRLVDPPSPLYL